MRRSLIFVLCIPIAICAVLFAIVHFSGVRVDVLQGSGFIAWGQGHLLTTSVTLMLIVVIPAFILAFWMPWVYREENGKAGYQPDWDRNTTIEFVWWGVPCVIVAILAVLAWKGSYELDPFKPIESSHAPMTIQVIALDWKWLFLYPEQKIASVNAVHFPKDTPINFELTADAPMNAFWIPQLGGMVFAMPAMRNKLQLIANEAGSFRGSSSNLSGLGFAGMTFTAVATSQSEFARWLDEARSSPPLTGEEYHRLAQPSEYHPVATYRLEDDELFDSVMMKYMMPQG